MLNSSKLTPRLFDLNQHVRRFPYSDGICHSVAPILYKLISCRCSSNCYFLKVWIRSAPRYQRYVSMNKHTLLSVYTEVLQMILNVLYSVGVINSIWQSAALSPGLTVSTLSQSAISRCRHTLSLLWLSAGGDSPTLSLSCKSRSL